jgi:hypothetical protein
MGIEQLSAVTKNVADASAALIAIGTIAKILPSLAALLTVAWLAIRIWESDTVRGLTHRVLLGRRPED